jgi:hypothetical protein
VEALVHKVDVPARAKERGNELTQEAIERGIELHQQAIERGSAMAGQAIERGGELKTLVAERGSELGKRAIDAGALQGAVFGLVKAALSRVTAQGYRQVTGHDVKS